MDESLRLWFRRSVADILPEGHNLLLGDDESAMVHTLGKFVFSLSDECSIEDVYDEMSSHFGRDLTDFIKRSSTFLIEACLICAVSSLSADRTRFVQIIMKMESAAQSHIMGSLKNNLQHYFEPDLNTTEDSPIEVNGDDELNGMAVESSPLRDNLQTDEAPAAFRNSDDDFERGEHQQTKKYCYHCKEIEIKKNKMENEFESVISKDREIEAKMRSEMTSQANKLIDAELVIIEMDERLSSKNSQLEAALASIREDEDKIRACNKLISQLQVAQDQVDILKPMADRTEASELQVEKLRSKLDELKGVRLQLKAESAAHTETHAKLVECEQEVDSLRKMKTQVDEYRGQCAESAIQIEELASRLRQRDREILRLEGDCQNLRGGQQGQRLEAQHLSEELRAANEQLRGDHIGGDGVGQGMSELNPALMNELHKLRTDNQDLLSKIDKSSMDSLDLLESQIADQKCINSSLQDKWMTAKDSLAQTLNVVAALNDQLSNLKNEYIYFQQLAKEASEMAREELLSTRYANQLDLMNLEASFNDNFATLERNHAADITSLSNILAETEEVLKTKISILLQVETEKERVMVDLSFTEQELKEEKALRLEDIENAKIAAEKFLDEKKEEMALLREGGQEQMQRLIDHHEVNLTTEIEHARDAVAELDAERIKRRRVDREKKFFEAETHRLKTLLTVSTGGASGQDIEDALKEMKSMQTLLDEANSEIQILRSQGCSEGRSDGKESAPGSESEVHRAGAGVRGGAVRPQRAKGGEPSSLSVPKSSSSHLANAGQMGGTYGGYLEQAELIDKRVDQLTREKRDLLSKNLEENKERMEISQKLVASEREVRNLKAKVTKMVLEKERAERRAANMAVTEALESPEKKIPSGLKRIRDENTENL